MDESGGWETGPRELFWSLLDTPDSAPFVASLLEKFYRPERHRIIRADVGQAARVLSILGPEDWIRACRTFPRAFDPTLKDYWDDWLSRMGKDPLAPVILPDWGALRKLWDAVYLSPWAYATCEAHLIEDGDERFFLVGGEPCLLLWPGDQIPPRGRQFGRWFPDGRIVPKKPLS